MHRTHSIALALATTAAVAAFALLPAAGALADDSAPTSTPTSTTTPDGTSTIGPSTTDPSGDRTTDEGTEPIRLHEVKVRSIDADTVRVTWALEGTGAAPTGYTIALRTGPSGISTVVQTAAEPAGAVQHDFIGLDPATLYSATVTGTEADGSTLVAQSNAVRTDRTAERKAADTAGEAAKQAEHEAANAAKVAKRAAKRAAEIVARSQQRSDRAATAAARQAVHLATKATRAAARLEREAARAAARSVRADHVADAADQAASESAIANG